MVDSAADFVAAAKKKAEVNAEIARLAALSIPEYEGARTEAAKALGMRVGILDELVAAKRPHGETTSGQGRSLELPTLEPWPEPVDGAELVAELTAAIRRYVILSANDALAVALWAIHTFCFEAFVCTPRLAITSPEKRCGKTTLLDVLALLVSKALSTANISPAAVFRIIEAACPTVLIDEADCFLGEKEDLRGILNSGHRVGGQVYRTVGDDFEVHAFSIHSPVAIAQIGKLPDTLADACRYLEKLKRNKKLAREVMKTSVVVRNQAGYLEVLPRAAAAKKVRIEL